MHQRNVAFLSPKLSTILCMENLILNNCKQCALTTMLGLVAAPQHAPHPNRAVHNRCGCCDAMQRRQNPIALEQPLPPLPPLPSAQRRSQYSPHPSHCKRPTLRDGDLLQARSGSSTETAGMKELELMESVMARVYLGREEGWGGERGEDREGTWPPGSGFSSVPGAALPVVMWLRSRGCTHRTFTSCHNRTTMCLTHSI